MLDTLPSDRINAAMPDSIQGVLVSKQERDDKDNATPGAIVDGLWHRDIITAINDKPTPDVATFKKVFKEAVEAGKPMKIIVCHAPDSVWDGTTYWATGLVFLEP